MNTILTMALMLTSACGYSPILNHTSPDRILQQADSTSPSLNCRYFFKLQNYCADFVWLSEPKNSDESGSMRIYFWKPENPAEFVSPSALVGVKLWMSSMGHGSGKVLVNSSLDSSGKKIPGIYEATQVNFVMPGEWDILIQLKDSAGVLVASEKLPYYAH